MRKKVKKSYQTDVNDPINGILKKEFQVNNVLMESSSKRSGDVYSLLKTDPNSNFSTLEDENSWIKASLKDNKSFIIKQYSIKSNSRKYLSWKLEGKLAKTDQWIEIDKRSHVYFGSNQLQSFSIKNNKRFDSIKLTHIRDFGNMYSCGKNSFNSRYLELNEFEISGIVYKTIQLNA